MQLCLGKLVFHSDVLLVSNRCSSLGLWNHNHIVVSVGCYCGQQCKRQWRYWKKGLGFDQNLAYLSFKKTYGVCVRACVCLCIHVYALHRHRNSLWNWLPVFLSNIVPCRIQIKIELILFCYFLCQPVVRSHGTFL